MRLVNDKIHELIFSRETDKVEDRISSRKNRNTLRVGNPIAGDWDNIRDMRKWTKQKNFIKNFIDRLIWLYQLQVIKI